MLTVLVDTVLSALDKQWWTGRERVRLPPARVVLPKRGMCRRHGGATNITETLEQLLLDFTDGFRDTGIEKGHATKNWSSTQTTRSMIESGRRSSSTDRKMKNCWTRCSTTPYETCTRNIQTVAQTFVQTVAQSFVLPVFTSQTDKGALANAMWPSVMWGAPAWHPQKHCKNN